MWLRDSEGTTRQLRESDYDFLSEFTERIATFYPKAYEALCREYSGCALKHSYYLYRIACRFIRCNFAVLDTIPDIGAGFKCTFEHINCPLRGECRNDRIICHPVFDHRLSPAEKRVLALVYEGRTEADIAEHLHLSEHTVHTHVKNAYTRLGLHCKAEFMKYATQHNLFS